MSLINLDAVKDVLGITTESYNSVLARSIEAQELRLLGKIGKTWDDLGFTAEYIPADITLAVSLMVQTDPSVNIGQKRAVKSFKLGEQTVQYEDSQKDNRAKEIISDVIAKYGGGAVQTGGITPLVLTN